MRTSFSSIYVPRSSQIMLRAHIYRQITSSPIRCQDKSAESTQLSQKSESYPGFGLEDAKNTLIEDMTSIALDELHEHRELRKYYRKIAYELPALVEYRKPFTPPQKDEVLQFRTTTYLGENHPASSKVVMDVYIDKLKLDSAQVVKLMKLAGSRIDHGKRLLHMSCERFSDPAQNKKYLSDLLDKLLIEVKEGSDTFEDIPLDTRHMKSTKRPSFPKSWRRPTNAI